MCFTKSVGRVQNFPGRNVKNLSNHNTFSIATWNIHGLGDKLEDPYVNRFLDNHDIVILTETWLEKEVDVQGFIPFSKIRPKTNDSWRHSGGITVLRKPFLKNYTKIVEYDNPFFVWIKCVKEFFGWESDRYICASYIPPSNSVEHKSVHDDAFSILDKQLIKYMALGEVILLGDFNSRTGTDPDFIHDDHIGNKHIFSDANEADYESDSINVKRNSKDQKVDNFGRKLLELCNQHRIRILNGRTLGDSSGSMTYYGPNGSSVIDYCIVAESIYPYVNSCVIGHANPISDHAYISVKLQVKHVDRNVSFIQSDMSKVSERFKWDKGSFIKGLKHPKVLQDVTTIINDESPVDMDHVNKTNTSICDIIMSVAKMSLKRQKPRSVKQKRKPWFNDNISRLRKEVLALGKRLKQFPKDPIIKNTFTNVRKSYKKVVKSAKLHCKRLIMSKLDDIESKNPGEFWKLIKKIKGHKASGNPIDPDVWLDYFSNLFKCHQNSTNKTIKTKIDSFMVALKEGRLRKLQPDLDEVIHISEIKKAVKNLKYNKAVGLDELSNEMIKCSIDVYANLFTRFFNSILSIETVPESWGHGYIVPLFKSGSVLEPNNYRGITISSCLSKVFISIMHDRLFTFLEDNSIMCREQIGFKKKARTSDHLFVLKSIVDKLKRSKKKLYACFVDLKKAFDTIWREALFYKLFQVGISCKFIKLVHSLYASTQSCVRHNGYYTSFFAPQIGTRQGCILSPTLFNLYLNDLPKTLSDSELPLYPVQIWNIKVSLLMYADDMVLLSTSATGLQNALNVLSLYLDKWNLTVNTKKSNVMVFNSRSLKETFKYKSDVLDNVSEYTYLGILLHKSGLFTSAQKRLSFKAGKALCSLLSNFNNRSGASPVALLKLFDSMIKPILMYGSEVWGLYIPTLLKKDNLIDCLSNDNFTFEKIHLKALKHSLGVSKGATNIACILETGRYPILIDIIAQCVKYILRLFTLPADSLLGLASMEHIIAIQNSQSTPFLVCSKLFREAGLNLHDVDKDKLSLHKINSISHKIRKSFITLFNTHAIQKIKTIPKLEFYSTIKNSSRMEPYLNWINNPKFRSVLTRFRISNHYFPVESLRCTDLIRNQRLCLLCDAIEPGGLLHCIFMCPAVKKIIAQLHKKLVCLSPQVTSLNQVDILKYLLSCNDKDITLLCMKPFSDIDRLHRERYDVLKPLIVSKIKGNIAGLSTRGVSTVQFISSIKTINSLCN